MLRLRTFGGLWIETVDGARLPNPRPRRLAVLAILAAAGPRGVTRSRLKSIFWPDAADEPAGHALSQTIYALGRDLGARVVVAEGDLRLDPGHIQSDIDEFRAAVARRDWAAAEAAYQGPFAAGFSLEDSPEFERWLEAERAELARLAGLALEALAREAEAAGDRRRAAEVWRRLIGLDPISARYAASYMSALAALGDRAGAIAHARWYAAHVRHELDAEPDPIVTRLAAELRGGEGQAPAGGGVPAAAGAGGPGPVPEPSDAPGSDRPAPESPPRVPGPRRRSLALGGVAALALAALSLVVILTRPRRSEGAPVLAVGQLRDLTAPDSARPAGVLAEVLATSLARLSGVEVIGNSRILELLEEGQDTLRAARTDAARRAGATEVIEGELVPTASGQLRLDLRRVEIGRGAVRGGYSVSGTDRLALIDSATALLAAELSVRRPQRPLADLTPRSALALRLYEEGLQAYYRRDRPAALRLFRGALAEDSTFAMAAYYAYRANYDPYARDPALEALALRLSARAPDRDRLIIRAAIGLDQHDPAVPQIAETLAARFPRDPEALLRAAEGLSFHQLVGPRARELFERAIALDSAAGVNPRAPCRLCDALASLTYALQFADSGEAAERVIRRSIALFPSNPDPVVALAMLHFSRGRYETGAGLLRGLEGRAPEAARPGALFLGRLLAGRLDEAEAECLVHLGQEDPRIADPYRWPCAIVLRNQGRYQDASALVFSGRLPDGRVMAGRRSRDVIGEFVLDLEMDRPRAALQTLESAIPQWTDGSPPGRFYRDLTWFLARRGTAAVMARELDLARRLADSAEMVGRRSLYGRDPLLHFFIRGLIAQAANDHHTAVDFFRRSIFSWNYGYTRANLALAMSLVALGRAEEAIGPLQAALRGGWDGSNLYVTRTELHEQLAQAFAAVGRRDSAAAHFGMVERAWRRADPPFAARYQAARDFLVRQGITP